MITGILTTNFKMLWSNILYSFKFHLKEMGLSFGTGIFAFITLQDIPILVTILGTIVGTFGIPSYFGWRRYKKQEEREGETAIIRAIKDLRELGFINQELDSIEVQRQKAIEWLSKPVKNV